MIGGGERVHVATVVGATSASKQFASFSLFFSNKLFSYSQSTNASYKRHDLR